MAKTARTATAQPTAAEAHEVALRKVRELVVLLQAQIDENDTKLKARLAETGGEINWAHVGNLNHLSVGLEELLGLRG